MPDEPTSRNGTVPAGGGLVSVPSEEPDAGRGGALNEGGLTDGPGQALEVLDPTAARHGGTAVRTAPRLTSLEGRTIGLLWNGKANGDVALRRVAELVAASVPGVTTRFYTGSMPCPPALVARVAEECDAVIGCTADCGSCSSWMTHDCVQIEKANKPTVIIASAGFEHDVESSARAFAMPHPYYVVVPAVYNNLTVEQAVAQTEQVVNEVLAKLTTPSSAAATPDTSAQQTWSYRGDTHAGPFTVFNQDFIDRDWGDGYPLWPPTRRAVDELLAGVDGKPGDLVCLLPPGNGEATVEKVAVNAAMAGCRPPEMPVVMAILRAISKMPSARGPLMSTSAHAPFVLVNGPMGRALGINGKRACLGPGKQNEVNIRIGRAVVFALKNLGSWYPGVMDMDTIGTTRKNVVVVAENEDESPWEPFHVSRGFAESDDAVTVFFTSGEWDISIQGHVDAQQLALAIASFSGGNNSIGYFTNLGGEEKCAELGRLLLLPPPHAIPLARDGGFSKRGLEKFMYHNGREPVSRLVEPVRKLHLDGKIKPEWRWVFDLPDAVSDRMTLPVIERPESYSIAVVGSVRAKDLLMPTRIDPYTEPISITPVAG